MVKRKLVEEPTIVEGVQLAKANVERVKGTLEVFRAMHPLPREPDGSLPDMIRVVCEWMGKHVDPEDLPQCDNCEGFVPGTLLATGHVPWGCLYCDDRTSRDEFLGEFDDSELEEIRKNAGPFFIDLGEEEREAIRDEAEDESESEPEPEDEPESESEPEDEPESESEEDESESESEEDESESESEPEDEPESESEEDESESEPEPEDEPEPEEEQKEVSAVPAVKKKKRRIVSAKQEEAPKSERVPKKKALAKSDDTTVLSKIEVEVQKCIETIDEEAIQGMTRWARIGRSLAVIKSAWDDARKKGDRELSKRMIQGHDTFSGFLKDRWGLTENNCYVAIKVAQKYDDEAIRKLGVRKAYELIGASRVLGKDMTEKLLTQGASIEKIRETKRQAEGKVTKAEFVAATLPNKTTKVLLQGEKGEPVKRLSGVLKYRLECGNKTTIEFTVFNGKNGIELWVRPSRPVKTVAEAKQVAKAQIAAENRKVSKKVLKPGKKKKKKGSKKK